MDAVFERAKAIFGTTDEPIKSGWILPDGTMLDLSKGGHRRALEHTAVWKAYSEEPDRTTTTYEEWRRRRDEFHPESARKFEEDGAVRFSLYGGVGDPEPGKCELTVEMRNCPTTAQQRTLLSIMKDYAPDAQIEGMTGDTGTYGLEGDFGREYKWTDKEGTRVGKRLRTGRPGEASRFLNKLCHTHLPRNPAGTCKDALGVLSSCAYPNGGCSSNILDGYVEELERCIIQADALLEEDK